MAAVTPALAGRAPAATRAEDRASTSPPRGAGGKATAELTLSVRSVRGVEAGPSARWRARMTLWVTECLSGRLRGELSGSGGKSPGPDVSPATAAAGSRQGFTPRDGRIDRA